MQKITKTFLYAFTLTLGVGTGFVAVAWTGPTGTAPNNNTAAPVNVGSTAQSKAGGLVLNTGGAASGLVVYGNTTNKQVVISSPSGYTSPADFVTGGIQIGLSRPYDGLVTQGMFTYDTAGTASDNLAIGSRSDIVFTAGVGGLGAQPERMRITSAGSVVIANTTPYGNASLTVMPNNTATWTEIVNYNNNGPYPGASYGVYSYGTVYAFYGNGPIYGSAFYYTSDERLKKNIQTIASSTALAKVLALNPVTFNWIAKDKPQGTQIGFIAQQVEKVVPELILTDPKTDLKAVDYARVVPLLTGAVQEQQATIEAQEAKLNTQQARIDKLEAEVELLKAKQ